jgi:hypothetical protein
MAENDSVTPNTRKRRPGQRLTADERKTAQKTFLDAFSMTANVRAACLKAGISRNTVYEWQEHDDTFSFQFKQATEDANDMIRAELFRRAVQGYDKPLVSMGKVVYGQDGKPLNERVYSDQLLSLLAKARLPEFKEKQQIDLNAQITTLADQAKDELLADLSAMIASEKTQTNDHEE